MKVCAIVVTYGDRFKLLNEVISSIVAEGIDKIILVDNGSADNSRKQIENLKRQLKNIISVIYLDENKGSAVGFRTGLESFYKCKDCEFAWVLDDDNKPEPGALEALKSYWGSLELKTDPLAGMVTALASFRKDRNMPRDVNRGVDYSYWIKRENYFLGFHIFDFRMRMVLKLKNIFGCDRKLSYQNSNKKKKMPYSPYGGFFLHKSIIDLIGYPDNKFYLYGDDREYTTRILDNRGEILLVSESVITDIDSTWDNEKKGIKGFIPVMLRFEDMNKLYHSVVNDSRRKSEMSGNRAAYFINKSVYLSYLFFMALIFRRMKQLKMIVKANKVGESLRKVKK